MGFGETSESSISLPSVQSVSLLTEFFPKLLRLLLEGWRVNKSGDMYAGMKSSSSSSSSELKGGVLYRSEPKWGYRGAVRAKTGA